MFSSRSDSRGKNPEKLISSDVPAYIFSILNCNEV